MPKRLEGRKLGERIGLQLARARALTYLAALHTGGMAKANNVALAIWPGHSMTAQGAGGAASRILNTLKRDGLAEWTARNGDWGWRITPAGRAASARPEAR